MPSSVSTSDRFLLEPIQRLISGCFEFGFWSTLRSTAEHLEKLDKTRRELQTYDANGDSVGDPHFEFFVLVIGLGIASVVFGVECFLKERR